MPNLFCIGTLPGVNPHGNTPAIVISAFALVGLGVFFANGAASKRAKLASGILFAVMASSLIFPVWTTVWSGFVVESSYTNRNGFAILLVLVLLAAEGMCRLGNLDRERRVRAIAWGGGAMTAVFAASIAATRLAKGTWLPSFKLAMLEIALLAGFTVLAAAIAHAARRQQKRTAVAQPMQFPAKQAVAASKARQRKAWRSPQRRLRKRTRERASRPALPTAKRPARTSPARQVPPRRTASHRPLRAPHWLSCLLASKCTLLTCS